MNQTLPDLEAICINDGSPDNCLKILKDYKRKYGEKIVIIDKNNEGVWKGRMDGIKIAKGEFIGFLDSDDYVVDTFVELMYKKAVKEKADAVVCGFDRIDLDTGNLYSREMINIKHSEIVIDENPGLLLELNGAPWNKIFKAENLKNLPQLKNVPPVLDDMMFQQLIFLNTKKIVFVDESLNRYMVRKDSIINTVKKELIEPTYKSMIEVRSLYEKKDNKKLIEYVDANAFLHLAVSLMYRGYADKTVDYKKAIQTNIDFLNKYFPKWKTSPYISLKYVMGNKRSNLKLWIVKIVYRLHLFKLFLLIYTTMINKAGIDIKW